MEPTRQPRTVEQATELAERYALLDHKIAQVEEIRKTEIAKANASADAVVGPLVAERDAVREKLQPWWAKAGATLTEGKRKTVELGGCIIGSRAGLASLGAPADAKAAIAALTKNRWAKSLLLISVSLDRKAILKALEGKRKAELEQLGFCVNQGDETFVLERVQQNGTLAGQ